MLKHYALGVKICLRETDIEGTAATWYIGRAFAPAAIVVAGARRRRKSETEGLAL